MKNQLLSTTTLAAAVGLFAFGGPIQEASASEPLEASIGGYLSWTLDYWDQEQTRSIGRRNYAMSTDGEVQVSAKTTLDNGIKVGIRIEFEAHNQGAGSTIVDEHYVTLEGEFGQLRLGNDDNAAYQLHYQAPVAQWRYGVNSPSFAILSKNGNAVSSYISTYPGTGGDGTKIIYFTPRINSIQLAVSYQADGAVQEGPAPFGNADGNAGQQSEILAAGANIVRDFEGGNVAASIGYTTANLEGSSGAFGGTEDRQALTIGLNVGFGDISVGFAYKTDDAGTAGNSDKDTFDIGFTHTVGALTWGVNYGGEDQEVVGAVDDEVDAVGFSATYSVGPGLSIIGGVKYYEYDSAVAAQGPNGVTAGIGALVTF